jgi:hypothetical protein
MDITKGVLLYKHCQESQYVRDRYAEGDLRRAGQTKHGYAEHAIPVVNESRAIADQIRLQRPGLIDDYTYHVILPFGALLHDIGGCLSIDEHDKKGAQLMMQYLPQLTLPGDTETLDFESVKRISRIIAYHRAGRYLKHKKFQDHALDIVLLADKSVGDEDRVRPWKAFVLGLLTKMRLACIPLQNNGEHDRINFAIQSSKLVAIDGREMVLQLKVKDEVLKDCPLLFWRRKVKSIYEVIFEHAYYKKNFHSMERAAANLGYDFYLEFNGVRYTFDKAAKTWNVK